MTQLLSARLTDPARLAVLSDAISPREFPTHAYDPLTRVAATALDVPVVLVSLVDDKGQFFQGMTGLLGEIATCRSTPLSHSFCRHVVESGAVLRIVDSRTHPLVSGNPVIEELGVVGYLGIPLTTSDGHCLGSLCAITHTPREWTPEEETTLRDLSQIVISDLELRADLTYRERLAQGHDPSLDAEGLPARAEDLLEQLHEGAAAIDRQWRLTYVNAVGARALQLDRNTAIGTSVWEAVQQLPGSPFERLLREAAAGHQPLEEEAYVASAERWFDVRVAPARHGLSVYFTDTTERRRTVEALQLREAQLRQSQKMEAIGSLAGGIAHDFNNLLTVIRANTELLMDEFSANDDARNDERLDDLREIHGAAARAATLTQQLLAFGRKQPVHHRPVDVSSTMLSLTPMLRRLIPSSVSIESRSPGDLPQVFMDAGQLEQVVINLAVNARDAMPNGGTLRLHVSAQELYAPTRDASVQVPAGRWLTISVTDTGTGIDANTLPRIFEPFFTTKEVGKGTGLGLATVFRIVSDAQGLISVESRVGQGTRFRIYLPACTPLVDAVDGEGEMPVEHATTFIPSVYA